MGPFAPFRAVGNFISAPFRRGKGGIRATTVRSAAAAQLSQPPGSPGCAALQGAQLPLIR